MPNKEEAGAEERIDIFGTAYIKLRGKVWQIYIPEKGQRVPRRLSLRTRDKSAATLKAQQMVQDMLRTGVSPNVMYSLTVGKAIDDYLELRREDVHTGSGLDGITPERVRILKTQLSHWRKFLGENTLISSLTKTSGKPYKAWRLEKGIQLSTIRNEQSAMNAVIRRLHDDSKIPFPKFEMTKIRAGEVSTRNTRERVIAFSSQEIEEIEKYLLRVKSNGNQTERICACYFLFQMMTGCRPEEARKILWSDVQNAGYAIAQTDGSEEIKICKEPDYEKEMVSVYDIEVRAPVAKNRKRRIVKICDPHNVILGLRMFQMSRDTNQEVELRRQFIFRDKGLNKVTKDSYLKLWREMVAELKLRRPGARIYPKSFRHTFITQRIEHGFSLSAIADIVGSSEGQIRDTYYHLFDEVNQRSALQGVRSKGGIILM